MRSLKEYNDKLYESFGNYRAGKYRLGYHIMPPAGWMNDPHAPVYFRGRYHLFYNLNPFSAAEQFAPKGWAHLITDDFTDFEYLPFAIAPEDEMDQHGCASGCAVVHDDTLYLVYTGKNRNKIPPASQAVAVSIDGISFRKCLDKKPVLIDPRMGDHCRDPKLFRFRNHWHMLLGNSIGGHGRVVIYTSTDLLHWEYKGVFCASKEDQGSMWECPDYERIGGKDYLFLSPEDFHGKRHHTVYLCGQLSNDGLHFEQKSCHDLDSGPDFYAPACFRHEDGRTILIGWMNKWFLPSPSMNEGWMGALTIPRELRNGNDGFLEMHPLQELEKLRGEGIIKKHIVIKDDNSLEHFSSKQFELRFVLDLVKTSAQSLELKILCSEDRTQCFSLLFSFDEMSVTVDRSRSGEEPMAPYTVPFARKSKERFNAVLFVDRCSVELLINDGTTSITNRVYPGGQSTLMSLTAKGGFALMESFEFYPLRDNIVTLRKE